MDWRSPPASAPRTQHYPLADSASGPLTMTALRAPRRSSLSLGTLPTAAPCARLHTRQVLWEWMLPVDVDAAELLVSELVTNGVQAAGAVDGNPPVGLYLSAGNAFVLIQVWDGSILPPVPAELEDGIPALDHEGGRGLFLVEALSERWGWHLTNNPPGKVTWCEIRAESQPPRRPRLPRRRACKLPPDVHAGPPQVFGAVTSTTRWQYCALR